MIQTFILITIAILVYFVVGMISDSFVAGWIGGMLTYATMTVFDEFF